MHDVEYPTYDERYPPLTIEQLCNEWPEAMVAWDTCCDDIGARSDFVFRVTRGKRPVLYVDIPNPDAHPELTSRLRAARWYPKASVWVRSSHGVTSYPRRQNMRKYPTRENAPDVARDDEPVLSLPRHQECWYRTTCGTLFGYRTEYPRQTEVALDVASGRVSPRVRLDFSKQLLGVVIHTAEPDLVLVQGR